MLRQGLSKAELKALASTCRQSHYIRVTVEVLDRNEQQVNRLDGRIIEGSVDYDSTADITRSLSLTILDPAQKLQWVPDSPSEAAVYADNFLRVRYGVLTSSQGWVDVNVFWGPVISIDRQGPLATIQAVGKESLALSPVLHWYPGTKVPKGKPADQAIRQVLAHQGEARFAMEDAPARLPRTLSLPWDSEPWKVAKGIARAANRQLFYDGLGRVRLRPVSFRPVYTFRTGPGGDVLDEPRVQFDISNVRNTVRVTGPVKEKEKTHQVHAQAVAVSANPLSPVALGRHGGRRYLVDPLDVPKLRGLTEARAIAKRRLQQDLLADVRVELECLPIPHLEEGDPVVLRLRGQVWHFRITSMSLPLVATSPMSINLARRVRSRRRAG